MLKLKRWHCISLAVGAVAAVAFVSSYLLPACYQICEQSNNGTQGDCAQYHLGPFLAIEAWGFFDAHNWIVMALATIAIAWFTGTLWKTTGDQLEHNRVVERAYVAMSHSNKMQFIPHANSASAYVVVKITNHGRTPAYITATFLDVAFDILPENPPYRIAHKPEAIRHFLVPNSFFQIERRFLLNNFKEVREGVTGMWLYGYVDYIDKFGTRHRGGYMRRYSHTTTENNLVLDESRNYNYDEPRKRGEDNDWNETF